MAAIKLCRRFASLHSNKTFAHCSARWFSTRYTTQHEYIKIDGAQATIGITDFAQNQLGDVVYVDLPAIGDAFDKG